MNSDPSIENSVNLEECDHRTFTSYIEYNDKVDDRLESIDIGVQLPKVSRDVNGKRLIAIVTESRPLNSLESANLIDRGFILPVINEESSAKLLTIDVVDVETECTKLDKLVDDLDNLTENSSVERYDQAREIRVRTYYDLRHVPTVSQSELNSILGMYLSKLRCEILNIPHDPMDKNSLNILRANLSPDKMCNFVPNCRRNDANQYLLPISSARGRWLWRRSDYKAGLFYYKRDSNGFSSLVKAQDSYAMSYLRVSGNVATLKHFLCERVIGEGYYYTSGTYDTSEPKFNVKTRTFYPMFLDILTAMLRQINPHDVDRIFHL